MNALRTGGVAAATALCAALMACGGGGSGRCSSDQQCPAGKVCSATGACVTPGPTACTGPGTCPAGQVCTNSVCVAGGCTANSQCSTGQVCTDGACVTPPALAITPDKVSLSPGQTQLFRASGGVGGYAFSMGPGSAGTIDGTTGLYTAPQSGDKDTVVVTDGAGAKANAAVSLVANPSITGFTAAEPLVTAGLSAKLTAVFTGGSGSIDQGVGAVASGAQISVPVTATKTFTLTVTNTLGVQRTSQITVQTVPAPSVSTFASTALGIIASATAQTVDLSATFAGGTGVITPGNLSITSGTKVTVAPLDTTTYTLTVSNTATTPATATSSVTVYVGRHVHLARGDGQTATVATKLPNELVAFVGDRVDAGVPGIPVHWTQTYWYNLYGGAKYELSDGGVGDEAVTYTDSQGEAKVPARLGTYATTQYTYYAGVDNLLNGTQVSFPAAATPGPAVSVAAQSPTDQKASASRAAYYAPAVVARDQYNNGVPGVGVTFSITAGGGHFRDGANELQQQQVSTDQYGTATSSPWWMGPTVNLANTASAALLDGGSPISFSSVAQVLPEAAIVSDQATVVLGTQILFSGSYVNSSDGTQRIDHGVGEVANPTFSDVPTRASFNYATSPTSFDQTAQRDEAVTYTLTVRNGAASPAEATATVKVTVLDAEWPLWRVPDSKTAYCVSYSGTGTPTAQTCTPVATGQDGEVQADAPTYNQTASGQPITDSVTGLAWRQAAEDATMPHSDALTACHAYGPQWRLPTAAELVTLLDYGAASSMLGAPFDAMAGDMLFWTASADSYASGQAWTVSFLTGDVTVAGKTQYHYVRCVK